MKAFRFSELALEDVRAIAEYTRQTWGAQQTANYIDNIIEVCDRLAWFPGIGTSVKFRGIDCRCFLSGEHRIVYRQVDEDMIEIARIIHTRSDDSD
ncbi:type II toxin-antitoxin system RelE/ParE family toxin [Hyphobacterium sp.]|uniref:type II toxin-antitoxin system RelE/ParE family toxin n=1 Tax=Hyphobacterium sp. TaxID=2004662 RepID=UPI003BAA6BFE